MCKICIHSLSFIHLQHVFGQVQYTSRVWWLHVEQSPKPLAILTFNQVDVRSVYLTVCRTTQPKQSQTHQLNLMKENKAQQCIWFDWLRFSSRTQLTFTAEEEPSLCHQLTWVTQLWPLSINLSIYLFPPLLWFLYVSLTQ